MTASLSPGLRTRTDTLVLVASEVEEESREPELVLVGLLEPIPAHDQSHAQSHVQINDAWLPV